jgi:hypothetical protein
MNWYFVDSGEVKLRSADRPPETFTHPTKGAVSGLASLEAGDLVDLGWFAGEPTPEPPHNPDAEKCFIQPQLPSGVVDFQMAWRAYRAAVADIEASIAAGKLDRDKATWPPVPAAPTVLEQWVVQPLTAAELTAIQDVALREVRWRRNMLLMGSDFLMLPDAPIDDATRQKWISYRAALRSLPQTITDPRKVTWPTSPDGNEPAVP